MRPFSILLMTALLLAAQAQYAAASLAVIWRTAVLSWDSPTTQWQDETALQGSTHVDAGAEAQGAIRPAPVLRLGVMREHVAPCRPACFGSSFTRSPPSL
jgi:hypothetical protein